MKKKQKEILNKLAKEHGLTIQQAEEIFNLFIEKIVCTISEENKMINGEYISERFKTIHVDNFGKFVPNQKRIRYANMCLKRKRDES